MSRVLLVMRTNLDFGGLSMKFSLSDQLAAIKIPGLMPILVLIPILILEVKC